MQIFKNFLRVNDWLIQLIATLRHRPISAGAQYVSVRAMVVDVVFGPLRFARVSIRNHLAEVIEYQPGRGSDAGDQPRDQELRKTSQRNSRFIRFALVLEDMFAAIPDGECWVCHLSIETLI